MSDGSDTISVMIWRVGPLDYEMRQTPEAMNGHRERRKALEEVFADPAFVVTDWDEKKLKDEKESHEVVEIIVKFVQDPNVQQAALQAAQQAFQWAGDIVAGGTTAALRRITADGVHTLVLNLWDKVKKGRIRNFVVLNDNHVLVNSEQDIKDYSESAKRESIHATWIDLYFAMAFRPFETTQKVAELMWEAHGRQQKEASKYWNEAENFAMAFSPFETTQKVAELVWEAHGRQQKEASKYWNEAENKVWGPNRELIREVAYFMWDMAGKQPEMATSFWVAAQKYVAILMALATKLSTTPNNLMSVFSPATYFHRVQDLAHTMCRRAGLQAIMPALAFWLSAENHILTMLAGVATVVETLEDAANYLGKLSDFSNEKYLRYIEGDAYYRWERAGKPFGKELEHWIESEEGILARIRERIGTNTFEQF